MTRYVIALLLWVCRVISVFVWFAIFETVFEGFKLPVGWYLAVVANTAWELFEIRRWKARHPAMPARRKQLIVLLFIAAWVSLMFVGRYSAWNEDDPARTPDIEMSAAFFSSLPVVLFGGVLFWWFGKEHRG